MQYDNCFTVYYIYKVNQESKEMDPVGMFLKVHTSLRRQINKFLVPCIQLEHYRHLLLSQTPVSCSVTYTYVFTVLKVSLNLLEDGDEQHDPDDPDKEEDETEDDDDDDDLNIDDNSSDDDL